MKRTILIFLFAIAPFLMKAQCLVQINSTNVTCYGACDGTASAFPVGIGPYTFTWSPGNMTTQNVTGLCAGVYTVAMFDAGFVCTATATVTITQPQILNLILTSTPASCPSCCDGTMTATVGGGTPNYTYLWTPNVGFGGTVTNLCVGSYTCCVTDQNGCLMCSNLTLPFLTDVQDLAESSTLSVYPSPAADIILVDESFKSATNVELSMSNILGETVYSKHSESVVKLHESIDLNALPNGIYFIKVKTDSGDSVRRFIKE